MNMNMNMNMNMSDQLVAEAASDKKHNTHKKRRSMPSAKFAPATPKIKQLQTYDLYRRVTRIGW